MSTYVKYHPPATTHHPIIPSCHHAIHLHHIFLVFSLGYLGFHQGFWTAILFEDLDVKTENRPPKPSVFRQCISKLDADGKRSKHLLPSRCFFLMVMNPMAETKNNDNNKNKKLRLHWPPIVGCVFWHNHGESKRSLKSQNGNMVRQPNKNHWSLSC